MSSGPPIQPPYQQPPQQGGSYPPPEYGQQPPQQYAQPPYGQQAPYPHPPQPVGGIIPYAQQVPRKYMHLTNCPRCGSPYLKEVKYTWWGGVVGPSAMSLVRCLNCKMQFNAKTFKDAKTAITLYAVIGTVIGLVVGVCAVVFHWWG